MPTSFSSEDLGRVFDGRVLTRGRTLVLLGAVQVSIAGDAVKAVVEDKGRHHVASITPSLLGRRVAFVHECNCQSSGCVHLAAASLAALDRYPELRRAEQTNFFDRLAADAVAPERQRLVIEVAPGEPPHACFVSFSLLGERQRSEGADKPAHGHAGRDQKRGGPGVGPSARRRGRDADRRAGCLGAAGARPPGTIRPRAMAGHRQAPGRGERAQLRRQLPAEPAAKIGGHPGPHRAMVCRWRDRGGWPDQAAATAVAIIAATATGSDRYRRRTASATSTASDPVIIERPLTPVLRLAADAMPGRVRAAATDRCADRGVRLRGRRRHDR